MPFYALNKTGKRRPSDRATKATGNEWSNIVILFVFKTFF